MTATGEVLMVAGAVFVLLAGIGGLRFPDVYSRMHTAAKAPTLGLLLIAIGVGLAEQGATATIKLVLIVLLFLFTGPVGVHVLGRAVHQSLPPDVDVMDELRAADEAAARAEEESGPPDR